MIPNTFRFWAVAAAAGAALLLVVAPARVRSDVVSISVNGQQVQFDQPPIERSGRVFVPLRGVFERLGATVVYDNGTINATGNGRNIELRIGSNIATVNGQQETLDVAPFLVGARTLVPLRFISESLGANVNYDDNSRSVAITMGNAGSNSNYSSQGVGLTHLRPGSNRTVSSARPAVSASFTAPVDPNSVHIVFDGRDVSSNAYVSRNDFMFTPAYDLAQQNHTVEVAGRGADGSSFDRSWSFATGSGGSSSSSNFLNNLQPSNGATVGQNFTVRGRTLPNASVRIAVTSSTNIIGGVLRAVTGSYTVNTQADGYGNFAQSVNLNGSGGGQVVVNITSIDPNTNAGATATLNLNT
ncbi:MAG: copper amine oxidase N-terminal domain-containing protein [Candidatus Eremiobacteraeota bacterium]|nr:copper amine oxidase N-terminal domain-containing protein [Candidatus Eremiobacteraeota bacterium]